MFAAVIAVTFAASVPAKASYVFSYSSVAVTGVTSSGYTVTIHGLTTSDPSATWVLFPTWTLYNGQDDLIWYTLPWKGNGDYSYYVPTSDHTAGGPAAEFGSYRTDTYICFNNDGQPDSELIQKNTVKIDTTPPSGSSTISPGGITSGSVTINVTGTDDLSGVASITTPDGTVHNESSVSYAVSDNGTYNFTITDNAGNTYILPVTVSNIDRTITVTHPVTETYTIDPNSGTFTAPEIPITNNSLIPVKVSVQSLKAAQGGSLTLTDAEPTKYADWSKLTAEQTKSDIALALSVVPDGWSNVLNAGPLYAADITSTTPLGVLAAGSTGNLSLSAKYGLAWDASYTTEHSLQLVFDVQ